MPVADARAVEQLQMALEALQQSSSTSSGLQRETGGRSHLPTDVTATQQQSSSPHVQSPSNTPPPTITSADLKPAEPSASSAPSQNPCLESQGLHIPPASAVVGAWDPWAEHLMGKSPSSPYYQPGSSDSDWDVPDVQHDHPDDPDSAQDHSSAPEAVEQDQEELASSAQAQSPCIASAMAEAQHRLDQLAGLAASHADVQQILARESDLGYAWGLIDNYTQHLQRQVWALNTAVY